MTNHEIQIALAAIPNPTTIILTSGHGFDLDVERPPRAEANMLIAYTASHRLVISLGNVAALTGPSERDHPERPVR